MPSAAGSRGSPGRVISLPQTATTKPFEQPPGELGAMVAEGNQLLGGEAQAGLGQPEDRLEMRPAGDLQVRERARLEGRVGHGASSGRRWRPGSAFVGGLEAVELGDDLVHGGRVVVAQAAYHLLLGTAADGPTVRVDTALHPPAAEFAGP